MKKLPIIAVCALIITASGTNASAGTYGRYLLDGSNTAWFVQLSDTHVDSNFKKYYLDNIEWMYGEAAPVIEPNFIVVTGDLSDSTTQQGIYGLGPRPEEWSLYKSMMTNWGMTPGYYFDIPGNHDAYGDIDLSYYLENSVQGRASESTQQSWRIDLPGGTLMFFSADTSQNDGKQWPADNKKITNAELVQITAFLDANTDAVFKMGFGHHDYAEVTGAASYSYQLTFNEVMYYSHGHEHDVGARVDSDGVIRFRVDSLGQSAGGNIGLWAVDNRAVTVRAYDAQLDWPMLIITAPADGEIGSGDDVVANTNNPPVPKSCDKAPVRALVFDAKTVTAVSFRIDSGAWTAMKQRTTNLHQWRGYFDATKLSAGEHTVTVKAVGTGTSESSNTFYVENGLPCDLGQEDPDFQPDGGSADAGGNDGGHSDAAVADAGADSGQDPGIDGGSPADAASGDSGSTQDSGAGKDASASDGSVANDTGLPQQSDGSEPDAEGVEPPDNTTQQATSGCSCSTIGL
jgi:hypothetical protein